MPLHYRAAVLHAAQTPMSIETVTAATLKPTDVLVRVRAAGLCHTDLEVIDGVKVTVDGAPLDPCVNVMEFTKNGFEWSYEGPEPRQLALALLVDHLGDKDKAKAAVEPFMQAVVANFGNEWEMTSADLDEALAALGRAVA